MPCNDKCREGCNNGDVYGCNDCGSFKLTLNDLTYTVEKAANDCSIEIGKANLSSSYDKNRIELANKLISDCSKDLYNNKLFELIEIYRDYFIMKEFSQDHQVEIEKKSVNFCVNECPIHVPFQTANKFCSREK